MNASVFEELRASRQEAIETHLKMLDEHLVFLTNYAETRRANGLSARGDVTRVAGLRWALKVLRDSRVRDIGIEYRP